ncbi:MAG: hypothetical protein KUG79_19715 [Pseudomonadales bacterium]|nr:hypothetical protein [Pseudomonadales bacterium]
MTDDKETTVKPEPQAQIPLLDDIFTHGKVTHGKVTHGIHANNEATANFALDPAVHNPGANAGKTATKDQRKIKQQASQVAEALTKEFPEDLILCLRDELSAILDDLKTPPNSESQSPTGETTANNNRDHNINHDPQ